MQKFSTISGHKVSIEKPIEISKEQLEFDNLKLTILGLLDETLSIRNEGSLYKHEILICKIDGKEMFVEALLNLLSEKDNKKSISHLESLKSTNKDWKSIDDKIDEIKIINENIHYLIENNECAGNIKEFLDKYSLSEDFDDILEQQILKVNDYDTAILKSKIALLLENDNNLKYPKNRIRSIANKYNFRAKQLLNITNNII